MASKSELFSSLPDIDFAAKDPDTITQEVISRYELITGRSLARADPVRLFLNAVILELVQQRNAIDFAAKMNLLAYAEGDYLDHLGANIGVSRLGAASAVTTVLFTLSSALGYDAVIPEGTRITPDGKIYFSTTEEVTIAAGNTTGTVSAVCLTEGEAGNDYVAGQITRIVDTLPYNITASNVDTSAGGSGTESDDAYRERIQIAPESFTTAGSLKAYEYYALSTNSDIAAVSVVTHHVDASVSPGNVNIYVLMNGGVLPDSSVLQEVEAACSGDDVRPDTDYVHALSPETVSYDVNVDYWIDADKSGQAETIQANVVSAAGEFIRWERSALGRDINPSRLNYNIVNAGAKRCVITSPAYSAIGADQVAVGNIIAVNYQGLES